MRNRGVLVDNVRDKPAGDLNGLLWGYGYLQGDDSIARSRLARTVV
jgi:hypothetical protein